MLMKLLPFEIKLHLSQIGFWITFGIMFLIGFLIMSTDIFVISSGTGERVKMNGAVTAALHTSVTSLFAIFFGAIYVVSGVMRDDTSKALEIIHATPVSSSSMTLARIVGVFLATFLSMFAAVLGLFSGQFAPWIDQEVLGPINLLYYLQPTVLYLAVNALVVSAFFTSVAAFTRNRTLVYVSAVGMFLLYTASGLFVGEDAPDLITSLVDPFGSNALAITTEFWPAAEQNTHMSPLGGYIGLNRLVWGSAALIILAITFNLFKRGIISGKTKRGVMPPRSDLRTSVQLPVLNKPLGTHNLPAAIARFKLEYVSVVRSIAFMILSGMAIALFSITIYVQAAFVPDPLLPTNALMAQTAIGSAFLPLLIILIFFSGEIIWRDKTAGMIELIDSTRVANWPLMLGKWLAMFAVILTIIFVAMVVGILAQLILGDVPVNLATHLKIAALSLAPELLLYAALVMFVQNFMPNRIVGMIVGGALAIFFFMFIGLLPIYHPLMGYGRLPTGGFSELNGFGDLTNFRWFALYWGALAALFGVLSVWLWRRGLQTSLLSRLAGLRSRLSAVSVAVAVAALISFGLSGASIYKGYSVENDYQSRKAREADQVAFEKLLGDQINIPVPKIRSVETVVNFNPEGQSAEVSGQYLIENTTGGPVTNLYVTLPTPKEEDVTRLDIDGATRVKAGEIAEKIEDTELRLYQFSPPLADGAMFEMQFQLTRPGPSLGRRSPILSNGTFVNNTQIMPGIGVPDYRMRNPDRRRKNGLPELEKKPDRDDMAARQLTFFGPSADYVTFKATVCTAPGQIPIAPGVMKRAYEADGRACRDYEANEPIANFFAFVSAAFAVKEDKWMAPNGETIPLAIYYHPAHNYNIDLMMTAMKASLDHFTTLYGPYQYKDMRIMEFPYASFAQSFAGTIPFSENIGFMRNPGDPSDAERVDLATYVTMHEIAHQWFGHQIMPASTKGFNVLSEGLTENAAMTAYEAELGWQKARRVLEQRTIQTYLMSRTMDSDDEPPLALAGDQSYLVYAKASWVFWGLKQMMGEEKMQLAIRDFVDEFGQTGPPYPTTLQLIDALRAAAGPDYQQLITDYWDRITFWELSLSQEAVKMTERDDGDTRVMFTLKLDKKVASEETGKEVSITEIDGEAFDEWVEIGFYTRDPKETLGGDWITLKRVHLTEAQTALEFDLATRPTHILLDPRRLLIERNVDDNLYVAKD